MKITVTNRLSVLIRERQISSASEFGRRMTAAGFPISSSHASRYEKDTAPAFDQKFVSIACNVLQCLPNDLYNITVELEGDEAIDPTLALPRHAIVLRGRGFSVQNPSPAAAVSSQVVQLTDDKIQPSPTASKTKLNRVVDSDDDTGPSGVLFPYTKPK